MSDQPRTDQHRPSNLLFDPQQYDLAGVAVTGHIFAGRGWQPLAGITWDGIYSGKGTQGRCDHCGAHLKYWAALRHRPTGKYIRVGETCLDHRFSLAGPEFHRLREACRLDREREARRASYEVDEPEVYAALWDAPKGSLSGPLEALRANLRHYGSLLAWQTEKAKRLLAQPVKRPSKAVGVVGQDVTVSVIPAGVRTGTSASGRAWRLTLAISPTDTNQFSWFRGPDLVPGQPTVITGKVKEHRNYLGDVTTSLENVILGAVRAAPVAASAPAEPGYYVRDGEVYKIVVTRDGQRTYAKHLVLNPGHKATWAYAPGVGRDLAAEGIQRLSAEEASRLGHLHGICVICGAELTDPQSVERGIGPVCITRL